jgi:hypothetical protein
LQTYLISNYGNYLEGEQLIAGFRLHNREDGSLEYQLLYSTSYGTFTSILTFWPDSGNIQLKTLSVINFFIMDVDYSNCAQKDLQQQNCKVCSSGYRNFMGRCGLLDPACSSYITDECGSCISGKNLAFGTCQ